MKFGSYFVLFCVCSTMLYASSNSSSSSGSSHYRARCAGQRDSSAPMVINSTIALLAYFIQSISMRRSR